MLHTQKIFRCYLFILFISLHTYSQNAWDYIKMNNNVEARKIFKAILEKDSTNKDALEGLIYLTDIEGDLPQRKKYLRTLVNHHCNDVLYQLYGSYSSLKPKEILEKENLSVSTKLIATIDQANEYYYDKKFDQFHDECSKNLSVLNWSFLGPFQNVNGYGYEKVYEVEKDSFLPDKSYFNHYDTELKWVTPEQASKTGMIEFTYHLTTDYNAEVFYANSFINVEKDGIYQIRIARQYPIKLWVDDNLVHESKERTSFLWDSEIVQLKLTKGNHRLLIKYANGVYYKGKSDGGYGNYSSSFSDYGYEQGYNLEGILKKDYSNYLSSLLGDYSYDDYASSDTYLSLRITDTLGKLSPFISAAGFIENYSKANFLPTITDKEIVNYCKVQYEKNPDNWFNLYLLMDASYSYKNTDEMEEYFYKEWKKNPNATFFKFIMSEIYYTNYKDDKSQDALKGINQDSCPNYKLLFKALGEIDMKNDTAKYIAALIKLETIAPSNHTIISKIIRYYDSNGMEEKRKQYVEGIIEKYPEYKDDYEDYLETNNKPKDYNIGYDEGKEIREERKNLKKSVKNHYYVYDYKALIEKYKGKDKVEKVLALYNELIAVEPYLVSYRIEKAKYLYNKERYDEAVTELNEALKVKPYNAKVYELLGDISKDQKNNEQAIAHYNKAKALSTGSYSRKSVIKKIEKIQGPQLYKSMVQTKSFEEMLKDSTWKNDFEKMDAIILGYTTDVIFEDKYTAHVYEKFLIKILTEAGAKEWTETNFHYLSTLDYVKVIKSNGAELTPSISGNFVVFKNLEPGDMIQIETSGYWDPNASIGNERVKYIWLTLGAPIHYQKIEVVTPSDFNLYYNVKGVADNLHKQSEKGFNFYKWEFNKQAQVHNEEAILDQYDIYNHIELSTMNSWDKIVDFANSQFYRKTEANYEVKNILDSIISPVMTQEQKVEAVYNYIVGNVKYSFTTMLNTSYIPKDCGITLSCKIADCKDYATLMITMLKELGIESHYVLVKTNNYFHEKPLPSLHFNHAIAAYVLNGTTHYVDLTGDHFPLYALNEADAGAWALEVKNGSSEIFQLPNHVITNSNSAAYYKVNAKLNNRDLNVEVKSDYFGCKGGYVREIVFHKSSEEIKNKLVDLVNNGSFDNMTLVDYKFLNKAEINDTLKAEFTISIKNHAEDVMDMRFMKIPFISKIENKIIPSTDKRTNTIDLAQVLDITPTTELVEIEVPSGYKLRVTPKAFEMHNHYFDYKISFQQKGNKLTVTKSQKFKTDRILTNEFSDFKKYYMEAMEVDNQKLSFLKK